MISKFKTFYQYKAIYALARRCVLKKPLEDLTRQRVELTEKEVRSSKEIFSSVEDRNKLKQISDEVELTVYEKNIARQIFYDAMDMYLVQYGKTRRGHIQFIKQCLQKIKQYEIDDELEIYKKILEIFPEEIFIPISITQVEFEHFPLQQDTCIDILCAMEENMVIPDDEFAQLLYKRFGLHTSPMTRLQRMLYWFPKMRNLNPWPKPERLPNDKIEVAKLAIDRMSIEKDTEVTIHEVPVSLSTQKKSWFVASQGPTQRKLLKYYYKQQQRSREISQHDNQQEKQSILFVDGPYTTWMKHRKLEYFILNTELDKERLEAESSFSKKFDNYNGTHDKWYTIFGRDSEFPTYFDCDDFELSDRLTRFESVIDNRSILATCIPAPPNITATDEGSKGSLVELKSWMSMLCLENPELNKMKVVFRVSYPTKSDAKDKQDSTEKNHPISETIEGDKGE